jgi:hypothetical protein
MDNCYRCNLKIIDISTLSIEHKVSWRKADDPIYAFYDLNNIAFSHLRCNILAVDRKGIVSARKGKFAHGTSGYRIGCRCNKCKSIYSGQRKDKYQRLKT